jgi:hypothetical protein
MFIIVSGCWPFFSDIVLRKIPSETMKLDLKSFLTFFLHENMFFEKFDRFDLITRYYDKSNLMSAELL